MIQNRPLTGPASQIDFFTDLTSFAAIQVCNPIWDTPWNMDVQKIVGIANPMIRFLFPKISSIHAFPESVIFCATSSHPLPGRYTNIAISAMISAAYINTALIIFSQDTSFIPARGYRTLRLRLHLRCRTSRYMPRM